MKTRHAAQIRKGILAARDPELRQYVHLAPRLVREAARVTDEKAADRVGRELADAVYIDFQATRTGSPMIACNPLTLSSTRRDYPSMVARTLDHITDQLGTGAKQIDISITIPPDYQPKARHAGKRAE